MDSEEQADTDARFDRYSTRENEDGSLVLYDDENDEAWIRSDVTAEPMR